MKTINRRQFLAAAAAAATGLRGYGQASRARLVIPREIAGPAMPRDFAGLSYEVEQLANPAFFSTKNTGLIGAFKEISTSGVLRLGGNTSEFAVWNATSGTFRPETAQVRNVPGEPRARFYSVTPAAIQNLAGFLAATGWSCIYGIGMGTNTPERAAAEADFVFQTLGARLQYFQIGNEPDLYGGHLRDQRTWNVNAYLDEWLRIARAIAARVPGAKFGLPDVSSHIDWLTYIADRWPSVKNKPRVVALTHHYYFGGPATNPKVSIQNLLKPETMEKVQQTANVAAAEAKQMGVRLRMSEGNTCYRGGKPGVSDVFASALWAADYALLLAANHYSGVNLHGGTGNSVARSVGGFLPGDVLLQEQGETSAQIAAHPHPFYTPIAAFGSRFVLEPVGCGLQFAAALQGAALSQANFAERLQAAGVNASAYAAKFPDGRRSMVILNKDADRDLELDLEFGVGENAGVQIETLHAPALESRQARIARLRNSGRLANGRYSVSVPRASGMRVTANS